MDIQVESSELKRLINEMHDVTNTWSVADMVQHVWQKAQKAAMPDGFVLVLEKNISDWYLDETESMYLEEVDHWACDIEIGEVVTVGRKKIFDDADQYVAKVYIDEDDINWQLFDKKSEAQKAADHCKAMIEAVEAGE